MNIYLTRVTTNDQGTRGLLHLANFHCCTLELPWKDNARKLSSIPVGKYRCQVKDSAKFGRTYEVLGVPDRSDILFHSGNWAGVAPKYKTDTEGCILLGLKFGILEKQEAILSSRLTKKRFLIFMGDKPFDLIVEEMY